MNNITTIDQHTKSVAIDMANRYGMEVQAFEATVRATCSDPQKPLTREEFAAFLLVAKQYNLNPLTREIYAFPKKGGGIVPVVSIDGWMNLLNSHPAFDGIEFSERHGEGDDNLISITCTIFRKDRNHPISITEHLVECIRATEAWKMKHRMLRHKSAIQCARYAFGFSGIYDQDEAERIASNATRARDAVGQSREPPPPIQEPDPEPLKLIRSAEHNGLRKALQASAELADEERVTRFKAMAEKSTTIDMLNEAWDVTIKPIESGMFPPELDDAHRIYRWRKAELE